MEVPAIENMPHLDEHLVFIWDAFWVLSSSRTAAFGSLMPIPITEIEAYTRLYRIIDFDEQDQFVSTIRAIDDGYLSLVNKKSGESSGSS